MFTSWRQEQSAGIPRLWNMVLMCPSIIQLLVKSSFDYSDSLGYLPGDVGSDWCDVASIWLKRTSNRWSFPNIALNQSSMLSNSIGCSRRFPRILGNTVSIWLAMKSIILLAGRLARRRLCIFLLMSCRLVLRLSVRFAVVAPGLVSSPSCSGGVFSCRVASSQLNGGGDLPLWKFPESLVCCNGCLRIIMLNSILALRGFLG
ncbi:hypothetical protein KC319_g51 [Hortaea werneckii]|nr:hypothetical protein KC319_g51 [Hortaea werneckii]